MELQRLYSYTRQAIDDFHLIELGDKIAIGISGGKDSLTLLYALAGLRRFYPKSFEIVAISIDLGLGMDFTPIIALCETLKVPYHIVKTEIGAIVFQERKETHPCALCAKMRKGALNQKALELGCNKIAYGHHKDDVEDTLMMSILLEGRLYSFAPYTWLEKSKLALIRPLIYIPEKDIKGFQRKYNLPVVENTCPADKETKRIEIHETILQLEKQYPGSKKRLYSAVINSNIDDWVISRDPEHRPLQ